jgi:hypothetical protein
MAREYTKIVFDKQFAMQNKAFCHAKSLGVTHTTNAKRLGACVFRAYFSGRCLQESVHVPEAWKLVPESSWMLEERARLGITIASSRIALI